jgi:hypothetical protein
MIIRRFSGELWVAALLAVALGACSQGPGTVKQEDSGGVAAQDRATGPEAGGPALQEPAGDPPPRELAGEPAKPEPVSETALQQTAAQLSAEEPAGEPTSPEVPVLPARMVGPTDEGTFLLYAGEKTLATIRFIWHQDGRYENQCRIHLAEEDVDVGVIVECDEQGYWNQIAFNHPAAPGMIVREDRTIQQTVAGQATTIDLLPGTVLYENMSPALISQALLLYDKARGGRQKFPVYVIPHMILEGSLEPIDEVQRTVAGRLMEFARYTFRLPGMDMTVWVDGEGKLYLADVPAQQGGYVREGYEELRIQD